MRRAPTQPAAAGAGRRRPPLLLALATLLLLAPPAGARAAPDDAAVEPTEKAGASASLGGECSGAAGCGTENAVCERRRCRCADSHPVFDGRGRCLKAAKLNETCEVSAQCLATFDLSECSDGRCDCLYDLAIREANGNSTCKPAAGERVLGEMCTADDQCSAAGSHCHEGQCRCLDELPVSDNNNQCGNRSELHTFCRFDAQCLASTKRTACREGRCECQDPLVAWPYKDGTTRCLERGHKKYGDSCNDTLECGYDNAKCIATPRRICQCDPDFPATNGLDKCGLVRGINQSCDFNDQCERDTPMTECNGNICKCRFGMVPIPGVNGKFTCGGSKVYHTPEVHVDPTMIGVLVAMGVMFVIICVVLRLFSKARWRENRTIFNTPNPRLMNVSLLRDSKLLHSGERRGSRASVRAPSRQPSMASLRPQSPTQSLGSHAGSRRGSRASSNASGTSTKSPKSPTRVVANNTGGPVTENVTVDVQNPKA